MRIHHHNSIGQPTSYSIDDSASARLPNGAANLHDDSNAVGRPAPRSSRRRDTVSRPGGGPTVGGLTALAVCVVASFLQSADAYPALMLFSASADSVLPPQHSASSLFPARASESAKPLSARKRAFDRLDVSPFDFEALSKRFNDDEDLFYGRRRRAFDRLDDNAFLGLMSRKRRAFDRLEDAPFMLGKRHANYDASGIRRMAKRPFDRLDGSAFGIAKRRPGGGFHGDPERLSIADVLRRLEADDNNNNNNLIDDAN